MPIDQAVRERIDGIVGSDRVVLFMKGTPAMPQCGFSATTTSILSTLVPEYTTVNVLEDPELRDGIKSYSDWPTIPQLYIEGEFMGGCDIVRQMFNSRRAARRPRPRAAGPDPAGHPGERRRGRA